MLPSEHLRQAPPEEFFDRLPIPELIIACRRATKIAVKKTFYHRVLEQLADELGDYEFARLKEQVKTADGLVALILRKRSHWLDIGPVTGDDQ